MSLSGTFFFVSALIHNKNGTAAKKNTGMKHIETFEQFITESKNNSYPLNEMDMHTALIIANSLFFIVSVLTIYGFTGEAIDAIKRNIQKLKDIKDKRKINKDSIEDITYEIENLVDQLPIGKKNFLKGLISKLKSTVDASGNIDKDSALYLQREIDKYANQYGIKNTTM